ncbi:MAG: ATP-binding protein [Nanoarchaeota archaeon]|nr:ATP-binding protein [Nanoarchaeota archaeon]
MKQEEVVKRLEEEIILLEVFKVESRIIIYGTPGTGKTQILERIADYAGKRDIEVLRFQPMDLGRLLELAEELDLENKKFLFIADNMGYRTYQKKIYKFLTSVKSKSPKGYLFIGANPYPQTEDRLQKWGFEALFLE